METVVVPQRQVHISVPQRDYHFLRTLSQKVGWTLHVPHKSGMQKAVEDVQAGRVYEATSVDDLFAQQEA